MIARAIWKENSTEIGFVKACVFSNAIGVDELRDWAVSIAQSEDEYPLYIVDLFDFDAPLCDLSEVIGFAPVSGLSNNQEEALSAIALLRGRPFTNENLSENQAMELLMAEPEIMERFQTYFPTLATHLSPPAA